MHVSFILFAVLGQPLLAAATSTIKPVLPTTLLSLPASPLPTIVDPIPSPASTLLSSLTLPATLTSLVRPTKTIHLLPSKTKSYSDCGGFRPTPAPVCAAGFACIDDPWVGGCGQACDMPGICVQEIQCGGFIGKACPAGKYCIDDPRDDCDPKRGGADCIGICI
ncbi:hypothetical protein GCG54_00012621 [Colletotrichum gloeosporioides]|uniref:Uncharacterized protein n=1 Tax=Colletotrichum gloeosporioides TaxID=474922 RepID=A0A8H4CQJ6_COLGL|nr:uncharacterized protein GCG54_00012621 [Colletotrichum gloeosporioides]KAF3808042.1 hypothetical protein GCG54_00012621 [Colletotrichum gloeosporioides]